MANYPDFSTIRMTCYPALSESMRNAQGHSVKSSWFANRSLPVVGRGPDKLFYSSSVGGGIINITDQPYFDDAIVGKVVLAGESYVSGSRFGSIQANISSDGGVLENRFSYDYIGWTYGLTDTDPFQEHPWWDKNKFDPVQYLTNSGSITWPVVLDDPSAVDILDYNGVIEPLIIRSEVGMSSTYVGDNLDPEPHSVKAGLGGYFAEEPYHRFNPITEFYEIGDSNRDYPFSYVVDFRIYEGFAKHVPDSCYTNDDNERLAPFIEKTIAEIAFAKVSDPEMKNFFIYNAHSASIDGRPTPNSKTKPRGFTYENCIFGSDSIVFGGLLR